MKEEELLRMKEGSMLFYRKNTATGGKYVGFSLRKSDYHKTLKEYWLPCIVVNINAILKPTAKIVDEWKAERIEEIERQKTAVEEVARKAMLQAEEEELDMVDRMIEESKKATEKVVVEVRK